MKNLRYFYFVLVLFFVVNVIKAQTSPSIQGPGCVIFGTNVEPAKTGIEHTYKLSYSSGTLSSDYKALVKWNVTNGEVIKKDGTIPSVTVKWNSGVMQGSIKASDVFDAGQKKMVEINSTVALYDSATITSVKLNTTVSDRYFLVGETARIQCSLEPNIYGNVEFDVNSDGFIPDNWDQPTQTLTGHFTTIGIKTVFITAYYYRNNRYEKIASDTKFVVVLTNQIEGPDVVCSGNEEVFTIPNIPAGLRVNWTLTGDAGLYITSGQDTRTITVRSNSYGNVVLNANILYDNSSKKISKNVLANTPRIQIIERWNADGSSGGPVYTGDILNLRAYPQYPPSICTYEWTITPKAGANISGTGPTAMVAVQGTGNYMVQCCVKPSCSTQPALNCANYSFNAQRRTSYNVSYDQSSKHIDISKDTKVTETISKNSQVSNLTYELYGAETGKIIKQGLLNVEGGTINVNDVDKSVYILKIVQNDNVETHKVMIK